MTKERLIETIKRILNTDLDFSCVKKLIKTELETLVCMQWDRVDMLGSSLSLMRFPIF